MLPFMGQGGLAARDTAPEDVDDRMLSNARMNAILRRAAGGRTPLFAVITEEPGPDEIPDGADVAGDEGGEMEDVMAMPRFADAMAMVDASEPRQAVRMVLADAEPDALAVQFATCVLRDELGAEVLLGEGYAPIAALLSLAANPDPGARDSAALSLLELDGPGDAHDAGLLMEAEGATLDTIVNRLRARASYQPLTWADREVTLNPTQTE